ncbi:MAG: DNA cytosine methyltransferase [Acidobacteria bacterium]|nr:DNA cytosine methyltransferase [Acidobacteriota bacterium]
MKSLELFAGAGGLGLGLHAAGFKPYAVIERDSYCCDTIRENKRRGFTSLRCWPIVESDVRDVRFDVFADKLDLVSGGPPCQPFSLGGKHRAYDDARDMFPQAIRAVRETRPRAFIFENVKGLTRDRFRNYVEYIKLQLEHPEVTIKPRHDWTAHHAVLERYHTSTSSSSGLRYNVVTRVLNAADFGVPQKRHRIFFVGFRSDLGIEWAFPEATHSEEALLWDQRSGDYWDRHSVPSTKQMPYPGELKRMGAPPLFKPSTKPWKTVRDALLGLPEPRIKEHSHFLNHRLQKGARSYPGHTGSPLDAPAKALKAGVHGVPGGENMLLLPEGSVRYFSIREAARIQTFSDDFAFHGTWSETMRQLGNAVPVDLATVVGKSVQQQLSRAGQGYVQ